MKISKLKYVFALLLLVVVSVATTNVQAATYNRGKVNISTVIASQLAAIEDGDEPTESVYDYEVYLTNSGYTNTTLQKNPVYFYSIKDKVGLSLNAYSVNYTQPASNNREEVTMGAAGLGADLDTKIGLALSFANRGLSYSSNDKMSYATQLYIWLAQAGLLNSTTESSAVNEAGLNDEFTYIRNSKIIFFCKT